MSAPRNHTRNQSVDRRLLNAPVQPIPPSRFRSWESQKDRPSGNAPAKNANIPGRKRFASSKLWWNRDFRVCLSFLLTALLAFAVYTFLKS